MAKIGQMLDQEMRDIIMLCYDKKLDFDISVTAKSTKVFVLNLIGRTKKKIPVTGTVEFHYSDKGYTTMIIGKEKMIVNFHNKDRWNAIKSLQ